MCLCLCVCVCLRLWLCLRLCLPTEDILPLLGKLHKAANHGVARRNSCLSLLLDESLVLHSATRIRQLYLQMLGHVLYRDGLPADGVNHRPLGCSFTTSTS